MVYRPPFITETDEPRFTDCQFCAGLMLVAEWTAGEAIHDEHGNTLDAIGLKRLRERIRVLSGDTVGGASLEDLARGVARRFPDLPTLPRTTAPVDPLRLSFDELWAKLKAGHCAVLNGNPIRVTDRSSPLRSMQEKDDDDHAVFVPTARGELPSSWTPSVVAGTRARGCRRWTYASSLHASRRPWAHPTARSSDGVSSRAWSDSDVRRGSRPGASVPSSPRPGPRSRPLGHRRCGMPPGPSRGGAPMKGG